jgi:hypothetical protein
MPTPHADPAARQRLKADIVAWVEAGTSLAAIAAQPDMPSDNTIRRWRRADESFGQRLEAALRRGQWRRLWAIDEAAARAFIARYRTGEPLAALLADPHLPGRRAFRRWLNVSGPFGEEVQRLKPIHAQQRRLARPALRQRRPFDQAVADRLLYRVGQGQPLKTLHRADPAMPTPKVVARWRREHPDFDYDLRVNLKCGRGKQRRVAARRSAALADQILTRVAEGAAFSELAQDPAMPSARTLRRWLQSDAAFAAQMQIACAHRDHMLMDDLMILAGAAGPGTVGETRRLMAPVSARLGNLRRWAERRG